MYCRLDSKNLSNKEISRFLKANAGPATWTRNDVSVERRFERSDRKAEASYQEVDERPTLKVWLRGAKSVDTWKQANIKD